MATLLGSTGPDILLGPVLLELRFFSPHSAAWLRSFASAVILRTRFGPQNSDLVVDIMPIVPDQAIFPLAKPFVSQRKT